MISFLVENQGNGNGKRDVHQKFDGGSDPKSNWVPPPRWDLLICFLDSFWVPFFLFKQKNYCGRNGYKTKDFFWSGSFLGWPGWVPCFMGSKFHWTCCFSLGGAKETETLQTTGTGTVPKRVLWGVLDMWQIQNRDEVNVMESPVVFHINLGRVELSVFIRMILLFFYIESAFLFGSDWKTSCQISIDGLLLEILDSWLSWRDQSTLRNTLPETNSKNTWKWRVGIRSFPFGMVNFRCELLVSGSG